jgi:hypothetical protein
MDTDGHRYGVVDGLGVWGAWWWIVLELMVDSPEKAEIRKAEIGKSNAERLKAKI